MASIAYATVIPAGSVSRIQAATVPKRGQPPQDIDDVLNREASSRRMFEHSGDALVALLSYFDENNMSLTQPEHEGVARAVSMARANTCFIVSQKGEAQLAKLAEFANDQAALESYYEEQFEESVDRKMRAALHEGVTYVRGLLDVVPGGVAFVLIESN